MRNISTEIYLLFFRLLRLSLYLFLMESSELLSLLQVQQSHLVINVDQPEDLTKRIL